MKKNLHILVSGASIAGLSSAYWLSRHGFNVTVVERAPHLRLGGQALDVRGPGLDVAARMGILGKLQARATKLAGMSIVDGTGAEISRSTERTLTGGKLDSPDLEVMRDDLCQVLYQSLPAGVAFLFDDRVTSVTQDEHGVDVVFARAAPRRFDLLIGADGLHSGVRALVFGPEQQFLRFAGWHVAVFSVPNFLALDHWEVLCQDDNVMGLVLATDKEKPARVYLGFQTGQPLELDYNDIAGQRRLMAEHYANAGWEFPRILNYMAEASDFYFYSASQVHMDDWSRGRVVLVGDAGYSVSPSSGQGTTVAMVGAYVLAGELAAHASAPETGIDAYRRELGDYVARNLEAAFAMAQRNLDPAENAAGQPAGQDKPTHADGTPDFDKLVQAIVLKDYG